MSNRVPDKFCEHYNLIPIWFITGTIYIFLCKDCGIFILRDFNNINPYDM